MSATVIDGQPLRDADAVLARGTAALLARRGRQPDAEDGRGWRAGVRHRQRSSTALVLAPSGFVHSMNYRSVMAFGRARADRGPRPASGAPLDAFIERLYPGRAATLRRPTRDASCSTTSFVDDAASRRRRRRSAKAASATWRSTKAGRAWSGVVPIETRLGAAISPTRRSARRRWDWRLRRPTPPARAWTSC